MKFPFLAVSLPALLASALPLHAGSRTSAEYSIAAETIGAGGVAQAQSINYALAGSALGQFDAGSGPIATSVDYIDKPGYVGTIYNVQGLAVSACPASISEGGGTAQFSAAPLLDDTTRLTALSPSAIAWSISSGPLTSISGGGVAASANVYQDTGATVRGFYENLNGLVVVTVRNVGNDDFGSYASDGIDDSWQVQYFGVNNPSAGPDADADGTGQNNRFKYLAGLNPLDPTSRFELTISAGQPGTKTLTFSPVYSGRTYTVQVTGSLTQRNWTTLSNATSSDNGATRIVTDPDANTPPRFYRVQISRP